MEAAEANRDERGSRGAGAAAGSRDPCDVALIEATEDVAIGESEGGSVMRPPLGAPRTAAALLAGADMSSILHRMGCHAPMSALLRV